MVRFSYAMNEYLILASCTTIGLLENPLCILTINVLERVKPE